ncbi:MAG: hypothetical protein K2Y37_21985 [Pirellulales bacterium]|nr:hypothetical protein [Pirellulales bacterium]
MFSDPANWVGGKAPTAADRAAFTWSNTTPFTVQFTDDQTIQEVFLRGRVTLDLGATHTQVTSGFQVGYFADESATVKLLNGHITGDTRFASSSELIVGQDAQLEGRMVMGRSNTNSKLSILDGGRFFNATDDPISSISVGQAPTSRGTINVLGAGSQLIHWEAIFYRGDLNIRDGAYAQLETLRLARSPNIFDPPPGGDIGIEATVLVTGANSKLAVNVHRHERHGRSGHSRRCHGDNS